MLCIFTTKLGIISYEPQEKYANSFINIMHTLSHNFILWDNNADSNYKLTMLSPNNEV